MKIEWKKTQSTVKPNEVDYASSPNTVYLSRNISSSEIDGVTYYDYELAKLTPAEYSVYAASQNYENAMIIMEAITDLYEML